MDVRARVIAAKRVERLLKMRLDLAELQRDIKHGDIWDWHMADRRLEDLEDGVFALEQKVSVHWV